MTYPLHANVTIVPVLTYVSCLQNSSKHRKHPHRVMKSAFLTLLVAISSINLQLINST